MRRPRFFQSHRSLTVGSLVGLVAGIAVGASLHGLEDTALLTIAEAVEPLGTLWTNALRMTVIPLVVAQLVLAVTLRSGSGSFGRLGGSTLVVFLAILSAAALFSVVVTPRALDFAPLDPGAASSLREGVSVPISGGLDAVPNLAEWIQQLVPANPFQAAADGAILPLIVFTLAFALAMTRISAEWRRPLEGLFRAVSEAMLVMVRWILVFTPIGVFALALALARQTGLGAVAALASFVLLVSAELFCFTLLLYPLAVFGGRVRARDVVQAAAPAQVIAVSTRSSLASLPALLDGAEAQLRIPTSVAGFVLPLSVATFKISVVLANMVAGLFLARLYGIELAPLEILTFALSLILLSFAAPGIPSLGVTALPAFIAIGIPIEGVLLLHAVDLIPDVFKTLLNVTGDMTAAILTHRWAPNSGEVSVDEGSSKSREQI